VERCISSTVENHIEARRNKKMKDCNRCNPNTRCRGDHKERCKGFNPIRSTWKLGELVLAHPNSLNKAFFWLPFATNFYQKNGGING
jgi:hypothetical protein